MKVNSRLKCNRYPVRILSGRFSPSSRHAGLCDLLRLDRCVGHSPGTDCAWRPALLSGCVCAAQPRCSTSSRRHVPRCSFHNGWPSPSARSSPASWRPGGERRRAPIIDDAVNDCSITCASDPCRIPRTAAGQNPRRYSGESYPASRRSACGKTARSRL